ncbi:MAG: nitrilase-related carbon-nitrogen hydrolase [Prevotella sp.]|nr:nitrilase-related carbon-nitrogen hydrolase [Prevotella sp.]
MIITVIQPDTKCCKPEDNIREAESAIARNSGSDLYVLPEMWGTGFITKPKEELRALQKSGALAEIVEWMKQKAHDTNAAICGSLATEENGLWYNRMHFVKPNGEVTTYDKSHLFTFGGEGFEYNAGTRRVIVEWRGVRILLQICYDMRFPMWCRNVITPQKRPSYDMIIYSTNWPVARELAYKTLSVARAIENQCFVVACNRVGTDEWGEYFGESAIIHPYGHFITKADRDKVCEITGEIDMDALNRYRAKFPTLDDIVWTNEYY